MHGVDSSQYDGLGDIARLKLELDIELAIVPVLSRYFKTGASGSSDGLDVWAVVHLLENALDECTGTLGYSRTHIRRLSRGH